jgi:hypothetical protein
MLLLDAVAGEVVTERPLDTIRTRVKRWVVVLERGTFVVDEPGSLLGLR